jgi:hypothetical protein
MIGFAVVREENGEILRTGSCPDADLVLQAENGSVAIALEDENVSELTHYYFKGAFISKPPKGDNELTEEALRLLRTIQQQELADTDWTQLSDTDLTSSTKSEWREYRAAIRDLPAVYPDIINIIEVVFPTKPLLTNK